MSEPDRETHSTRRAGVAIASVIITLLMPVMMITSLRAKSLTFDEPYCVAMGYHYLRTGEVRFASRFNPPLAPVLTALPVVLLGPACGWHPVEPDDADSEHLIAARFFTRSSRDLLTASRLVVVLVTMLLGVGVFAWSRGLFGTRGAVLSVVLFAFAPNILAHGRLATSDITVTAAFFFTVCFFRVHLDRHAWWAAVITGLFLGLALVAKLSAAVLVPVLLVTALAEVLLRPRPRDGAPTPSRARRAARLALGTAVVFVVALVVIAAAYRFEFSRSPDEPDVTAGVLATLRADDPPPTMLIAGLDALTRLPLPPGYVDCWAWLVSTMRDGHESYLCGDFATHGWVSYFPVAFTLKTTIPFLLLAVLGLALSLRLGRGLFHLLLAPAALFALSMTSPLTIGFRHVLPVMPFLLVLCGGALSQRRSTRVGRLAVAVVVLLAGWHVVESVATWPDYLAYFNEFTGGPSGGRRYLLDSNLDWGQDIERAEQRLRSMGGRGAETYVVFFGRTPPDSGRSGALDVSSDPRPRPGYWAVSVNELHGLYWAEHDRLRWLRDHFTPFDHVGHSILIYNVTSDDLERLGLERRP